MTSLPIGLIGCVFLMIGVLNGADSRIFLNGHSFMLVGGGTVLVLLMSSPWQELQLLAQGIGQLFGTDLAPSRLQRALVAVAKGDRSAANAVHPLMRRAREMWEQGVEHDLFESLLHQHLDELNQSFEKSVSTLMNLSKYPPALGMTGTVAGLVVMFSKLGPDKNTQMGTSLALAMTATFYGLILANLLILPLADRLSVVQLKRTQTNDLVFRALILIHRGEAVSVIEDKLNESPAA